MDLFAPEPTANLLPRDGTVNYFGPILSADETLRYYELLLKTIPWQCDEVILFGRRIVTARKVAWYADANHPYTYSGNTKQALAWTEALLALKATVENLTATKFNSCLLNLYHDGSQGMSWHCDDESSLVKHSAIASLSFGAERKFCLKHKQSPLTVSIILASGSLLVMKDETQTYWRHSLPKAKKITTPRINLTFRTMVVR